MLSWAALDLWRRRRGRSLLLLICLASAVGLSGSALLLSQALSDTYARLMQHAPALVIRHVNAGGWAPLPVTALAYAQQVPGVQHPRLRIWGVVAGPDGPLTIIGHRPPTAMSKPLRAPLPGQAIIGPGIRVLSTAGKIALGAHPCLTLDIIGHFPAQTALATRDLVWLAPDDARRLLHLSADQASDLAIDLFHSQEMQAIQADLAAIFPWPVQIADRAGSRQRHHLHAAGTGSMALMACIPVGLALALVVVSINADAWTQRAQWGVYKAMGWTTADVTRWQLYQALMVGLPAIILGLTLAYAVVFVPPLTPLLRLWLPAATPTQPLFLSAQGAAMVMIEMAIVTGLPYLITVLLTALRYATGDPWHLLQAGR